MLLLSFHSYHVMIGPGGVESSGISEIFDSSFGAKNEGIVYGGNYFFFCVNTVLKSSIEPFSIVSFCANQIMLNSNVCIISSFLSDVDCRSPQASPIISLTYVFLVFWRYLIPSLIHLFFGLILGFCLISWQIWLGLFLLAV